MNKIILEFEDETLAKNILGRLDQWGYEVYLNGSGDILGRSVKEYKVKESAGEEN